MGLGLIIAGHKNYDKKPATQYVALFQTSELTSFFPLVFSTFKRGGFKAQGGLERFENPNPKP